MDLVHGQISFEISSRMPVSLTTSLIKCLDVNYRFGMQVFPLPKSWVVKMSPEKDRIVAVIPVHNRVDHTIHCVRALSKVHSDDYCLDILVVDDGSTDGTGERVRRDFSEVLIKRGDGNLWWAGGVNVGLHYAKEHDYKYVYIVNDDNRVYKDTLDALYEVAASERRIIATSLVLNGDGSRILNAGFCYTGLLGKIVQNKCGKAPDSVAENICVDLIGSRSTLLPVECVNLVGYFDVARFPQHYSDFDYFDRAKSTGYKLVVVKSSIVCTEENTNYLHHYVLNSDLKGLLGAYADIRYPFNFKTIFHRCYVGRGFVVGSLMLVREIFANSAWLFLKLVLPGKWLRKFVESVTGAKSISHQ